ncbi:MAG: hypothetical protein FJ011_12730 [Chloroflexi bacterium]|nr:hypothetical protein [Chloroflexota bacterium]
MEVYFADLALYPDELRRLHEIVAGVYEQKIRLAAEAGAEGIFFCEDMGTQNCTAKKVPAKVVRGD